MIWSFLIALIHVLVQVANYVALQVMIQVMVRIHIGISSARSLTVEYLIPVGCGTDVLRRVSISIVAIGIFCDPLGVVQFQVLKLGSIMGSSVKQSVSLAIPIVRGDQLYLNFLES